MLAGQDARQIVGIEQVGLLAMVVVLHGALVLLGVLAKDQIGVLVAALGVGDGVLGYLARPNASIP